MVRFLIIFSLILCSGVQMLSAQTKVEYNSIKSTLNGEPFFVKGTYTGSSPNFKKIKEAGFNVVMSYGTRNMSESAALNFLDEAHDHGLYILFNFNADDITSQNIDKIEKLVNALKDHSALYAWYLVDEPGLQGIAPDLVTNCYNAIKSLDENHPVFTSNWQIKKYYEGTDVDMRQLYQGIPSKMQNVLSDNREGYISTINSLNINWVAILNTHATDFGIPDVDPIYYPSPGGWYKNVDAGSEEYAKRQNRGTDLNNVDILPNPVGKADRYGMEFYKPDNFPDSESRIRGQVACALAYRSNALFWWIWDEGVEINNRWGWYTIYHYTPTKNSQKKILDEIAQFEHILTSPKKVDKQVDFNGIFYRYVKDESDRELVIAFNESDRAKEVELSLSAGSSTKYIEIKTGKEINLKNSKLNIDSNGGIFLINDPDFKVSSKLINKGQTKIYPNPFSTNLTIEYLIANNSKVELSIIDSSGRMIRKLMNEKKNKGVHKVLWDGKSENGTMIKPGVYFCNIKVGKNSKFLRILCN